MNVVENESQLVMQACQGSAEAFEALVILYEPRIRRTIYGMTQDIQLTQDLCQETFLAAYRALPRMHGEELRFAPWLYRIALNLVRTEWRRRKHVTLVPFTTMHTDDDHQFDQAGEDTLIDEEQFEERVVQRELVQRVFSQMSPSAVLCLLMDAEGFSYKEIAETLQESLSAIRSRLSRARHTFQRIYTNLDREGKA